MCSDDPKGFRKDLEHGHGHSTTAERCVMIYCAEKTNEASIATSESPACVFTIIHIYRPRHLMQILMCESKYPLVRGLEHLSFSHIGNFIIPID